MKKTILITGFALSTLLANAQLKVYSGGKIYMGGTGTTPNSLLSVGTAGSTAVQIYGLQPTAGSSYAALKLEATTTTNSSYNAYGVIGYVPAAGQNTYGVQGNTYNATVQTTTGYGYGVYGYAGNSYSANYGVYGVLAGSKYGAGVYGTTTAGTTFTKQYAGYFKGEFETTDDTPQKVNAGSWSGGSDSRIKKDVMNFTDGLAVIRNIRPVNYKFNGIGGFPTTKTYVGVIAQEVNQVAPYCIEKMKIIVKDNEKSGFASDIVETIKDSTGADVHITEILSYNPDGLFYAMINSIKQLDSTVTQLQKQIDAASGQRSNSSGKKESISQIELASQEIILYNAEPNPFDGATTIRYFIPENITGNAYMVFYDMYGKEVNRLEIKEKGFGKIEANTENLASGIYSYSIIVSDKTIDTQKMLKNK